MKAVTAAGTDHARVGRDISDRLDEATDLEAAPNLVDYAEVRLGEIERVIVVRMDLMHRPRRGPRIEVRTGQSGHCIARNVSGVVRYSTSSPTPIGALSVRPQIGHATCSSSRCCSSATTCLFTRWPVLSTVVVAWPRATFRAEPEAAADCSGSPRLGRGYYFVSLTDALPGRSVSFFVAWRLWRVRRFSSLVSGVCACECRTGCDGSPYS